MGTFRQLFTLIFFLILTGMGVSGCTVDDDNGYPGSGATTWQLCDHLWQGYYSWDDGTLVDHQIIFYPDGRGHESLVCNYYGEVWEEYYEFYWHWANNLQNSVALNYPGGAVLYMDHIYIHFDLFSCLLDGTFVTFRGE